jgi:hypothetical protein
VRLSLRPGVVLSHVLLVFEDNRDELGFPNQFGVGVRYYAFAFVTEDEAS